MKIAIPTANGTVCAHFGHCETFTFLETDKDEKTIEKISTSKPPAHEPGVLPRWLAEQKVDLIIAGGMGMRAQQLFANAGIKVVVGVEGESPEAIAGKFLAGNLSSGKNLCDH